MILREDDERPCPPVIRDVLVKKDGWGLYDESEPAEEQPPFNLFWKTNRLYPSQIEACRYPFQRCNHYPKSAEITKKDGLYRNLKRMRVTHGSALYSFYPETFTLPNEYVKFCQYFADEREKATSTHASSSSSSDTHVGRPPLYICKPSDLSRGRKIFVFDDIGELTYDCSSVVQKYIDRPLLIFGHKVDFRIYVLVTSFQPLRVYMYDDFLTRFGGEKYTLDSKDTYVHLTNYSVTKTNTSDALLRAGVGSTCKWDGAKTRAYFSKCGVDFSLMWARIQTLVRCTLLSIFHLVPKKPQCFELFGFDILFDHALQPWLIEANFSPALAVESEVDVTVKHALIHDLVQTLNIQPWSTGSTSQTRATPTPPEASTPEAATEDPVQGAPVTQRPPLASSRPAPAKPTPPLPRSSSMSRAVAMHQTDDQAQTSRRGVPIARAPASSRSTAKAPTALSRSSSCTNQLGGRQKVLQDADPALSLIDKPHGGMKLIFPFNPETESLSLKATVTGSLDSSLKAILAEVRRADQRPAQQLKQLAAVYAECSTTGRE